MNPTHRAELIAKYNYLAEVNPPLVLEQIESYPTDQLSAEDHNLLRYFAAKSLYTMRQYSEAELKVVECLSLAITQMDYYLLVRCNVLQSLCSQSLGVDMNIRPCLELALEYAFESTDFEQIIYASSFYLTHLYLHSAYQAAREEEKRILDMVKRVAPSITTVSALLRIARFNLELHTLDKALKVLLQAYEHAQVLELPQYQLTAINNLASLYIQTRDFSKAEEFIVKGLQIAKELAQQQQVCLMLLNHGNLKIKMQAYSEAIQHFEECLAATKECRSVSPFFMLDLYNNFSMSHSLLGNHQKALEYIEEALKITETSEFFNDREQMIESKTNILVELGDFDAAKKLLLQVIKYYRKNKQYPHLLRASRSLATLYFKQNEFTKSFKVYSKLDDDTDAYIAQILEKKTEEETGKPLLQDLHIDSMVQNSYREKQAEKYSFIGSSKASHAVLDSALLAAQHQKVNVLIMGESGTGKEVLAQLIHKNSIRRNNRFVSVNVATISPSLIESELFGHTKGAFTGAITQTKGYFLQADTGTLFLDEVGEMPIDLQSKLLRVLETRKLIPVGSSKEVEFDSRIICATNQNLREQLAENKFRLDLYHRLNTIEITIPPLRERQEDIETLLLHFVNFYAQEMKKPKPHLDKTLLDVIMKYSFPGNVRELKNIVERMFILCKSLQWNASTLCQVNPFILTAPVNPKPMEDDEESIILKALIKTKGKQKEAARMLCMSEATLHRRIAKYNLQQYTRKGS